MRIFQNFSVICNFVSSCARPTAALRALSRTRSGSFCRHSWLCMYSSSWRRSTISPYLYNSEIIWGAMWSLTFFCLSGSENALRSKNHFSTMRMHVSKRDDNGHECLEQNQFSNTRTLSELALLNKHMLFSGAYYTFNINFVKNDFDLEHNKLFEFKRFCHPFRSTTDFSNSIV